MKLDVENQATIYNVSAAKLRSVISKLRSYGPRSFASITDDNGSFLQVAGGGVTCMVEYKDAKNDKHYRAYQSEKSNVFADGTMLSFGGGNIKLSSDEWFRSDHVQEIFLCFLKGQEWPEYLKWRDITDILNPKN